MSLESPLGKFLGHGFAKEGTAHWWSQRVTSVALLPLTLWFVVALLGIDSFAHADVVAWLGNRVRPGWVADPLFRPVVCCQNCGSRQFR